MYYQIANTNNLGKLPTTDFNNQKETPAKTIVRKKGGKVHICSLGYALNREFILLHSAQYVYFHKSIQILSAVHVRQGLTTHHN